MSNVFIAFQKNEDSRAIVNAILADNPKAIVNDQPAMVKIDVPGHLVVRKATIEEELGRPFKMNDLEVDLSSFAGQIESGDNSIRFYFVKKM